MRHLRGLKVRRKVVDSKDWLQEDVDILKERDLMRVKMEARRLAELKLRRIKVIRRCMDF